jgi:hypothetical protein
MTYRHPGRLGPLVLVTMIGLSACFGEGASPAAPTSPSTVAPSAISPSQSPSGSTVATPEASDPTAAAGELVQVSADVLRVRAQPGVDSALVGALERGAVARVESGPVDADGFRWLEVVDIMGLTGWAADGDDTDAWLSAIPDVTTGSPILTLEAACDVVGPVNPPRTTIMDDGWVIATETSDAYQWVIRQLSAEGLAEVRHDVLGSPYLQASATHRPEPLPGAEPPGHGACEYVFTIPRADAGPIAVTTTNWFGDEEEGAFYQPAPERKALDGIARNLIAIAGLLSDEAWVGPGRPYIGHEFLLSMGNAPDPAPEGAQSVDPADLGLAAVEGFGGAGDVEGCGTLTRGQAFELARVLNEADPGLDIQLHRLNTPYFDVPDGWVSGLFVPRHPTGEPTCEGL